MSSIYDSSIDDDYSDGSTSTNVLEEILYGSQTHLDINARYARFKIRDRIKQIKNERKVSERLAKSMGKGLHKLFKAIVNELKNEFPTLG